MSSSWEVSPRGPRDALPLRLRGAIERRARRLRKTLWQRRHLDPALPRRALFLVGCQRSGTNMFQRVLDASPHTRVYNEDARPAFREFRLRGAARVARLVARSPAPLVLFKPLCDSQHVDRLLDAQPRSRALWLFRRYPDVVSSLVRMWGPHQLHTIRRIQRGAWEELGWRGERLSPASLARVRALAHAELTPHEGGVLVWYLRNSFFFELELARDPRVRPLAYEALVAEPAACFGRVFEFLELPFEPGFAAEVSARAVAGPPFPELAGAIRELADELQARIEAACREAWPGRS